MSVILTLALKEFRDGMRNRWVAAAIVLLAGLTLAVALLGSAPVGTTKATPLSVIVASLSSLSVYLVPLIALMLSYSAIVGEAERGTLLLLLSYPVSRWQVIVGKFAGHLAILSVAITLGYGVAAGVAAYPAFSSADIRALFLLIGSSILLGAVFLALGYLLSAIAREQATAAGAAVALWLAMVLLYDLALVGVLLADSGHFISEQLFAALLIVNPADAFRIFNLSQLGVGAVAGLGGLGTTASVPPSVALGSMTLWVLGSGLLALNRFGARQP